MLFGICTCQTPNTESGTGKYTASHLDLHLLFGICTCQTPNTECKTGKSTASHLDRSPAASLNGWQQMAPPQSRPPYPCSDTFLSATHPLKCIHIYLAIQPGEKTVSSFNFLKQKKYLTVEGHTMSTNTVAVPLQGRAWANDSIGGLAAGQQDKHNTHIFIRQLHAGHMATC